ncbi:MAG: SBBP repeat-containing protein, partial [Candidatus Omnitrophica bacterium]|nr:SBBP repeat-containing protein [Candidatus Omnitrophota bacterium]
MNTKTHMVNIAGPLAIAAIVLLPSPRIANAAHANQAGPDRAQIPAAPVLPKVAPQYWLAPLGFEANQGQVDGSVRFWARTPGGNVFLTASRAVFAGPNSMCQMNLAGASDHPQITGVEPLPGKVNYFRGTDPRSWRTGIPTYAKVCYSSVYPGIDLAFYGNQQNLEYDFVVAPGADPRVIALEFQGAKKMEIDTKGGLLLSTQDGEQWHHQLLAYQEINGTRREVPARFVLAKGESPETVRFQLGKFDPAEPLFIDPVLAFSTYFGGSSEDQAYSIALDGAGNIYVAGQTDSPDLPTSHAVSSKLSGSYDVFVTKLNPSATAIIYSTYLGGNAVDRGFHAAVDNAGNAIVAGVTFSTNFPVAAAAQPKFGGGDRDGFVAKLNSTGSALIFSTYLGGSGSDEFSGVAVDRSGGIYAVGDTSSTNFPGLVPAASAYTNRFAVLLAKFGPDGSLKYSSSLGGSGPYDSAIDVAVDDANCAYLTGYASSKDFPLVNPLQSAERGGYDAFISKLNPAGTALVYSTFLGGSGNDVGRSIALDPAGNAYVSGDTFSTNFPTASPLQATNAGTEDVFVAKLNPTGSALVYSTYLGGSGKELGGIAVDSSGCAYLDGVTSSTNFPTVNPWQPTFGGATWDAFVAKINSAGSALVYSSFLGGNGDDQGSSIAVDQTGNAYVAGATTSTDFPTVKALQANGLREVASLPDPVGRVLDE